MVLVAFQQDRSAAPGRDDGTVRPGARPRYTRASTGRAGSSARSCACGGTSRPRNAGACPCYACAAEQHAVAPLTPDQAATCVTA